MNEAKTPGGTPSRRRRWTALPFAVVFLAGVVLATIQNLRVMPEISFQNLVPVIAGIGVAAVVVWLVVRERREHGDSDDDPGAPN